MPDEQQVESHPPATTVVAPVPLVVDVDGTLLRGDLSAESLLACLGAAPVATSLGFLKALRRGRASAKRTLAERTRLDVRSIPTNSAIIDLVDIARRDGRPVYLASASDHKLVSAIADAHGPFDGVIASDGETNMGGGAKAAELCRCFGAGNFDYAGNARSDLAVWETAREAIVVDRPGGRLTREAEKRAPIAQVVHPAGGIDAMVRALRPHQWLKNLLVFTTPIAAHDIAPSTIGTALVAFVVLSLLASSTYLANDLLDLPHDRRHPRKARRPLARGDITVHRAAAVATALGIAGFGLALSLPAAFLAVAAVYVAATLLYSLHLKRILVLDVFVLASLYALRVFAGAVATATAVSHWLLAFAILVFLALALVKRVTELRKLPSEDEAQAHGRGYVVRDADVLAQVAAAAGVGAVVVLALYITSAPVVGQYEAPDLLWLLCAGLLFWFIRLLMLANRGELDDDPVLFAATDGFSVTLAAMAAVIFFAAA